MEQQEDKMMLRILRSIIVLYARKPNKGPDKLLYFHFVKSSVSCFINQGLELYLYCFCPYIHF
jgi:hypothetical protein